MIVNSDQSDNETLIEALLDEGLDLFGRDKVAAALAVWRKVLELQPAEPRALDYIQSAGVELSAVSSQPVPVIDSEPIHLPPPTLEKTTQPWRKKLPYFLLAVAVGTVAGVGVLLLLRNPAAGPTASAPPVSSTKNVLSARPARPVATPPTKRPVRVARANPEQKRVRDRVEKLRKQALRHILLDEYRRAAEKITQALSLTSDQRDLIEILALVKDRQAKHAAHKPADPVTPPPPAVVKRRATTARAVRRRARKRRRARVGHVVISSIPRMAFSVDGKPAGMTPKLLRLPARAHKIAFSYKSKVLATREMTVQTGSKTNLDLDLSAEVKRIDAPPPPRKRKQRRVSLSEPIGTDMARVCVRSSNANHTVVINGKEYAGAPVDVDLPPGAVNVELRAGTKVVERRTIRARKGKVERVAFPKRPRKKN